MKVLLLYSTVDGHTLEICRRLEKVVTESGHDVTLSELTADSDPELEPFDGVVIGASIRYGKHRPEVARFIERNRATLEAKSSAFFSVNAVARKPGKQTPETNPYVRKFLGNIRTTAEQMRILVGDLLDVSAIESGKVRLRIDRWAMSELLEEHEPVQARSAR